MSSTKTNTGTTKNTATYARQPGASSPDIDTLRNQQFQIDPTITYGAAAARNRLNASYANPLGGYTTPQIMEHQRAAGNRAIDEQAAMATRAGAYDVNNQNYQKNAYLAALTAPPLVQTGSTGQSTESYKTPFSSKILPMMQAGAQMASGGIT